MDATADLAVPISGSERLAAAVDSGVLWFARYWSLSLATLVALTVLMPVIAPIIESAGNHQLAGVIYFAYGFVCHQRPERTFHLLGEPMAYCQRDLAIGGSICTALLLSAIVPRLRRARAASLTVAIGATLPLAVDGVTQLVGLRESTWMLRVVTGVIFAFGWCWFAIPRLEFGFRDVVGVVEARRSGANR
jgi:uncharacterized membrane protein